MYNISYLQFQIYTRRRKTLKNMVTEDQLRKNSGFLKSIREAKDINEVKKILTAAGNSCLKVLLLVIKACIFKHIPLELTEDEKKKLKSYKSKLRMVAQLKSNKSRYLIFYCYYIYKLLHKIATLSNSIFCFFSEMSYSQLSAQFVLLCLC